MIPVSGRVTTDFFEPRPLSKPVAERDHIHGAIDIGAPIGADIRAPEGGTLIAWCAYRPEPGMYWPEMPVLHGDYQMSFCNYFYDTYGGVLVLYTGERTHVITHLYANQIFNKSDFRRVKSYEEPRDTRFPLHAFYTDILVVHEGAIIGQVGNAGYSSGPHIHWEIHKGRTWTRWEDRIDPEEWEA